MLYSLRPSTTSGNSGAEQFNTNVSVPVENVVTYGAETPVVTKKPKELKPEKQEVEIQEIIKEESIVENTETKEDIKENIAEEIIDKPSVIEEKAVEETTEITTIVEKAETKIIESVEVDINEVVSGFEEARRVLKGVYNKVLNETFKPTLNDATVDLLAYIGARAKLYNKGQEFLKAFGVDVSRFSERYLDKKYLPIAFKISVWADKSKGLDSTVDILNGVLQTLFALNVGKSESEIVNIVKDSVLGIIEFLEREGINSGF